ncbi:MAG: thioredoxin [Clostridia bacterium]|nr:thioredoxin [Clostridia bacterium]
MVEQINKDKFDELLKGDKPVVCDFFATWCGPCKMLAPVMEQVSEQFDGKAVFVKVDIDKEPELSIRYGIMSIPLVSVFKNGEEAGKSLGYTSKSEMTEFLNKYI